MSFIFSNRLQFDDTPNLDAFGRLRTSQVTSLIEFKHTNDKIPLLVDEIVSGTGSSSTHNATYSKVEMSVSNNNEYVIRQAKSRGIYQPGKGQIFEASFSNFQLETDVIKRIGYFSSTASTPYNSGFDGFFLESNGPLDAISFQIWAAGTQILSATSSSWINDSSSIDWSKTQLMLVDFQWLGVGRLRFCLIIDGEPLVFVTNSGTNNLTNVYMRSPNQPIRYEIRSSGGAGTLNMICSQISLEGTINNLQKTVFIDNFTTRSLPSSASKYPLIGYRLGSNFPGIEVILENMQTLNVTNPGKADYVVTVELNPILSATPSFTPITNTPIEYALGTGAQTVTTSGHRIAGFMGSGSGVQVDTFDFKDNVLKPGMKINGTADQVWLCIQASTNNQDFRTSINISYFE